MVNEKRLIANKANCRLGGVKTLEGKEVSKYNAQKHGILCQTFTEYEEELYSDILRDIRNHFSPKNVMEDILVDRIGVCYVKLWRAQKAEAEFMKSRLHPRIVRNDHTLSAILSDEFGQIVESEGYIPKLSWESVAILVDTYSRYETSIENRLTGQRVCWQCGTSRYIKDALGGRTYC